MFIQDFCEYLSHGIYEYYDAGRYVWTHYDEEKKEN